MHHWPWSSLVQVMARRFFMLAKPLAKPVQIYIINWILRSMKFKSKCKMFSFNQMHLKMFAKGT